LPARHAPEGARLHAIIAAKVRCAAACRVAAAAEAADASISQLPHHVHLQETSPHDLLVAVLWRFAHLQLARAPGTVDACARAAAARLALTDEIALDSLRQLAAGLRSALTARRLAPRPAGWTERALGRLRLPRLSSRAAGSDGTEAGGGSGSLGEDAFYALGATALTARDAASAAEAAAAEVLDAPAASAQPGSRDVVAEALRRLADAIAAQHAAALRAAQEEAEHAERAAERARRRAMSGRADSTTATTQLAEAPKTPQQTPQRAPPRDIAAA
jgi:hypothetical protein